MSAIKNTQIDGDVSVGRNVAIGGRFTSQGGGLVKGNLKVEGWLEARNIKGANKGMFTTVEKLRAAYPHPHDGWWAIVGDTLPGPIYVGDGGKWVATGKTGGNPTVDSYAIQKLQEDVADLQTEIDTLEDDITDVLRTEDVRNSLMGNETNKPVSVALVNSLYSNGYKFMGIADTETAPYSTPEVVGLKLFYIAVEKGTYIKFGNKEKKSAASLMVLMSSDSGKTWTSEESADLSADISDLQDKVSIGKAPIWITAATDSTGDVSIYDVGTVIWNKSKNVLEEVIIDPESGRKVTGNTCVLEKDRIYVYDGKPCQWDGSALLPMTGTVTSRTYDLGKILSLTTDSTSKDIRAALIPSGYGAAVVPQVGDLLKGNDGRTSPSLPPVEHCYPVVLTSSKTDNSGNMIHTVGWLQEDGIRIIGLRQAAESSWTVDSVGLNAFGGVIEGDFELISEEI